jgi:Leucine-rich repeat (LRR) protein
MTIGAVINAQNVNISDANFKAYLVGNSAINTNGDTEIQVSEANAYTGAITVPFQGISNLTGIEAFTSIVELYCNGNQLTSLDVSSNTALTILSCRNNQLTSLDVSSNTVLTQLFTNDNQLSSLNVANGNNSNMSFMRGQDNANLTCIQHDNGFDPTTNTNWVKDATANWSDNCANLCTVHVPDVNFKNYLVNNSSINTNGNTEIECTEATAFTGVINCAMNNISDFTGIEAFVNITTLSCAGNQLTSIDLSQNTALQILNCNYNQLTKLDLSNNTALTVLGCISNAIDTLDLSNLTSFVSLQCSSNDLHYLNIANGNNSNQTGNNFNASSNPNLTCIQVDDVNYSTNNWTNIDASASFSLNCNAVLVTSIAVQGQNGATTITTAGGTLQMEASVLPTNATDGTYTWSVMNGTGSANIDANGLLTAVGNGTVDVIATANDGSGITGSTTITITNQGVAIKESALSTLTIYPNPVQNELFIDTDQTSIKALNIVDLSGKLIKTTQQQSIKSIAVSDLKQGTYILQVISDENVTNIRFIKS